MRFCEQIVPVESVEVLRMPRTEEPLRLARVQLATPAAALRLLREGHGRAMDGHPVSTFLDSGGTCVWVGGAAGCKGARGKKGARERGCGLQREGKLF